MSIKLLEDHLTPAEGEHVVKTFHCTTLDPMLFRIGTKINGYITVTNKRLIYFAHGHSGFGAQGSNRQAIELPIADVSNIEQISGTRFDIVRLIFGIITVILSCSFTSVLIEYLISQFTPKTGGIFGQLMGPSLEQYRIVFLIKVMLATFFIARSFLTPWNQLTRLIFAAAGAGIIGGAAVNPVGIFSLARCFLPSGWDSVLDVYIWISQMLGALAYLYIIWCLYWFIRRGYIAIGVTSKSGRSHPTINISGFSLWSKFNAVAWDAANLSPAADADKMFKELGALVTDIQTLGDHGIQKWSQNPTKSEAEIVANKCAIRKPLVVRYAVGFVLFIVAIMTLEYGITAHNQHQAELRAAATTVKQQLDNAIRNANIDQFARDTMPQMVAKAEQEELAGEAAFNSKDYSPASEHWKLAADQFSQIADAVKPFRDAESLKKQYSRHLQELISIAFNQEKKSGEPSSDDMTQLGTYLESHAPEEWILVKDAVRKAEAFKAAGQGTDYLNQWTQIINVLMPAVNKKVRADISLKSP